MKMLRYFNKSFNTCAVLRFQADLSKCLAFSRPWLPRNELGGYLG